MGTTKRSAAKPQSIDENTIISKFMNHVLEKNEDPKNVYIFCKENDIDETDFYSFYGSIQAVKEAVWVKFFENAIDTLNKDKNYSTYPAKNKLLSLYFTLFEILTLNRSYVLYSLVENKQGLKNLNDFKSFRQLFKDFVKDIMEDTASEINNNINKVTKPVFAEGAWIQFLFVLKFWIDDTSKSFEKTDIIIEKSINTVVDLLDTKPLENLFDLGKFLWKEKIM